VGGILAWLGNLLGYGYVFPYWLACGCSMAIMGILLLRRRDTDARLEVETEEDNSPTEDLDQEVVLNDDVKRLWLRLGWIANFVGWGAATVLRSLFSSVATGHFNWGPATWGFLATFYMVGRSAIFIALQRTHRWPYKPRFFFIMQALGVVSLSAVWLGPNFVVLAAAFLAFGLAAGAGYYASIYYSLHGYKDQATKSGLHESVLNGGALVAMSMAGGVPYLVGGAFGTSAHSPFFVTAVFCATGFAAMIAVYASSGTGRSRPRAAASERKDGR